MQKRGGEQPSFAMVRAHLSTVDRDKRPLWTNRPLAESQDTDGAISNYLFQTIYMKRKKYFTRDAEY